MRGTMRWWLALGFWVVAAGCAGADAGSPGTEDAGSDPGFPTDDVALDARHGDDGVAPDEGQDPGPDGPSGADLGPDVEVDVGSADSMDGVDTGPVSCDERPGFGCPCPSEGGCAEGTACHEDPAGAWCTTACGGGCPAGWACGGEVCVPAGLMLCAPCLVDGDCLEDGARCLAGGDEGSFCGVACGEDGDCPGGFACELDLGQCTPTDGPCECTERAIAVAATTICGRAGAAGRCEGARVCDADGLSDCDAASPEVETCDGVDNDCDGTTDGLQRPCATACGDGEEACEAGQWGACSAETPECTEGACCDGCRFRPPEIRCDDAPADVRSRCEGTCGGSVHGELAWRHCTGDAPDCTDARLVWEDQGVQQVCGGDALCAESGATAGCVACDFYCAAGACQDEPVHTVCVDAAFGADSKGPSAHGIVGKDATLAIALAVRDRLAADTADPGGGAAWDVRMTRTTDVDPTGPQRAAACAGADRILSIRINACCGDIATGVESWFLDAAHEPWAARVTAQVSARMGLAARATRQTTGFNLSDFASVAPAAVTFLGFVDNAADAAKIADTQGMAAALVAAFQEEVGVTPP